jgi:prepilin-type N-terminal cleavage/methylation domain-containing protein
MSDRGFTLVESLVAVALTLTVTGAVFALLNPDSDVAQAQPEAMDMQQRARVASDLLSRDLLMAGAGLTIGPGAGALTHAFAPVLPRRLGLVGADPFDLARRDAVTIAYVSPAAAQTTLRAPAAAGASALELSHVPACPAGREACGFEAGMNALVFDGAGRFDFFAVTGVEDWTLQVRHLGQAGGSAYDDGASVVQAELHTYYFNSVTRQLRHADGYLSDVPVIDHVVDAAFDYFGNPAPPSAPTPPPGTANCLYDEGRNLATDLEPLPPQGGSLAALPLSILSDGPWCGEGGTRFDADLLRVKKVRVLFRVQASRAFLRGAGADFLVPGTSRSALRALPDYTLTFDITPRNLSLGRWS